MRIIGLKTVSLLLTVVMLLPLVSVGTAYGYTADGETADEALGAVNFTNAAYIPESAECAVHFAARRMAAAQAPPDPPAFPETSSPDGLVMNKTVSQDTDGYRIMLEAYTTGNVTVQHTTKPLDIVLVIDQSGSMGYDMKSYQYTPVYSLSTNMSYYVQDDGEYIEVEYCSYCNGWTDGCYSFFGHYKGNEYVPMTSVDDSDNSHSQFFTRSESTQKRLDALTQALNGFVESVENKAKGPDETAGTDDDVNNRIAVVGFSSDGFSNTELLTGIEISETNPIKDSNTSYYPDSKAHNGVQYGSITAAQYENALQDVSVESGRQSVANAISALTAHGGTYTLDGLDMASSILENDTKKDEDRNKVVVLFTDGETNSSRSGVVNKAYSIKHDCNATVYTIGIFEGADGSLSSHKGNINDNNTLMHGISSNYPDARYVTSGYQRGYVSGYPNPDLKEGESYYLSADDAEALNEIFESIDKQIGAQTLALGRETVIQDEVTEYFCLPENGSDIEVVTYDCEGYENGEPLWSENGTVLEDSSVVLEPETRTVSVSGFDFQANYVSETGRCETDDTLAGDFRGRKIVVSFTVSVREGFFGGNNVPTNGDGSGIYADIFETEPTGLFRVPNVNVPIKAPVCAGVDKNIYLGGEIPSPAELINIKTTETEPWQTAYVSMGDVRFADESLSVGNTADTENIEINISVSPVYNGNGADCGDINSADGITESAFANVYVFSPVLNFKDSVEYYGDTAPDSYGENLVSETWKHGNTLSDDVQMFGRKPVLTLEYTAEENAVKDGKIAVKQDFPVCVTAKIGETDITEYTVWEHTPCDDECGFEPASETFLVHVKTCTLTVTKNGGKSDEPYLFRIYKDGTAYTQVTANGGSSVTVCELPVGNYTVEEDGNWSWRYDAEFPEGNTAVLSKERNTAEIICKNLSKTDQWHNSFSAVVKNSFGVNNDADKGGK
ncbi:MAG: VWA domain-containing protein [Clostridia bacterium]|nr:VWA domain-containing protein [Clostridia bacterium]